VLVFGLALVNLSLGLAGGLGVTAMQSLEIGYDVALVGGRYLALGVLAWRRRWTPAFWLAAGLFALEGFAQVVGVVRQNSPSLFAQLAGLLLRLVVLVPLIAWGAAATRAERNQP